MVLGLPYLTFAIKEWKSYVSGTAFRWLVIKVLPIGPPLQMFNTYYKISPAVLIRGSFWQRLK